jgi:hypothetical protein
MMWIVERKRQRINAEGVLTVRFNLIDTDTLQGRYALQQLRQVAAMSSADLAGGGDAMRN